MGRPLDKQLFGKVERKTWRHPTFRHALSDDARLLWVYFLSCPSATRCPGLIAATPLSIMEDMDWDRRGMEKGMQLHDRIRVGLKRTYDALNELSATKRSDGLPWLLWKEDDPLMIIAGALEHNLPDKQSIVLVWLRDIGEFPDTEMRRVWLDAAVKFMLKKYGKHDGRYLRLAEYVSKITGDYTLPDTFYDSFPYTFAPPENENENENENEKKSSRVSASAERKPTPAGKKATKKTSKKKSKKVETEKVEIEKLAEPPSHFTDRQCAFFKELRRVKFYVRGQGEMTAWEAVEDPVKLAGDLGDEEGYPVVDIGLVKRLGDWTMNNRQRSRMKKDLVRFIIGRAAADQRKGGTSRGIREYEERHGKKFTNGKGSKKMEDLGASVEHLYEG